MPKLASEDKIMFNRLLKCYRDCLDRANLARMIGRHATADFYIRECERCARHIDEIMAKYMEEEVITYDIKVVRTIRHRKRPTYDCQIQP